MPELRRTLLVLPLVLVGLLSWLRRWPPYVLPGAVAPPCSVTVVAEAFDGLSMVKRHRMIYQALDQEFKDGLHALSLTTKSVQESS